LLENALVDFALYLPRSARYQSDRTQRLVYGLGEGRLPRDVIDLPKIGSWVRDLIRRRVDPLLRGAVIAELLGWRPSEEQALIDLVGRRRRFLFRMVGLEIWGRLFFRGDSAEQPPDELLGRHSAA
jgi:hypothetical protein